MAGKHKGKDDNTRISTTKNNKKTENIKSKDRSATSKSSYITPSISALCALFVATIAFWYTQQPHVRTLAKASDTISMNRMKVICSTDYEEERKLYPGCTPQWCGRMVTDSVVSSTDAARLLEIAKVGFRYGGSDGGASILDLHSGALSKDDRFINIYSLTSGSGTSIFNKSDFVIYNRVKNAIHAAIAKEFGINQDSLYLTKPTFFSKMTMKQAKTIHDEYWHVHVDKETYGSFHYTSLLYLTDYGTDFTGGRFTFVDEGGYNTTVEPRLGRLSFFTSGSENKHFVEKLESGMRYAVTVSFTCDSTKAIEDPHMQSD